MHLYTIIHDSPNEILCILKFSYHHFANGRFLLGGVGHEFRKIPSVLPKVGPILMHF